MQETARESGISVVGKIPWGTHFCQLYRTKKDLLGILVPYFIAGLNNNEFCVWVDSANLSAVEIHRAMLKAMPDFNRYLDKGQIEILAHDDFYLDNAAFDGQKIVHKWLTKLREGLANGFDGLRLSGNTSWLQKETWRQFAVYEETVDNVITHYPMIALCTYYIKNCDLVEIIDVIRNHEFTLAKREGRWERLESERYRNTREMLVNNENNLLQLYNSMSEGMAQHEIIYNDSEEAVDYVITDVNPAYEKITGLGRQAVIGQKASGLYGTDEPPYLDIYSRTALTGEPRAFEIFFAPMQKHLSISVFSPGKGKFVTVFTDVTERKLDEQKLLEQTTILTNVSDAVIGYDVDYRINFWNRGAESLYGYSAGEALGQIGSVLLKPQYSGITRDDLIGRVLAEGRIEIDSTRTTRDGREVEVETHVIALRDKQNNAIGFVAIDRDTTERNKLEKRLQYLASFPLLNPSPVIEMRPSGDIVYMNPAVDTTFPDLRRKGGSHPYLQGLSEFMFSDLMMKDRPFTREVTVSGRTYEQMIQFTENGSSIRIYGHDITGRKENEEEINKLNKILLQHTTELEATNRELEAFAYSVSHDLRAPLRSLAGFSQILLEDFSRALNDEGKQYLTRIQKSAELMAQLIDDLLRLSQLTRAGMIFENVNLSELAEAVFSKLLGIATRKDVSFTAAPGLTGYGDEKLLSIALENLFSNALKFSSKSAHARVEFGGMEYAGKTAYYVRDNGAGFDMKYADKLFTLFQRLHSANEFPGTGIGLASVQRIINRHGGRVWAEATIGQGATFYFTLGQ